MLFLASDICYPFPQFSLRFAFLVKHYGFKSEINLYFISWQVIFLALDAHIKNVVSTYSLEHESIDELFGSVFDLLNVLLGGSENVSKPFQEVVFCIGTIKTFICQHMLKEEEQVDIYFSTPLR